MIASARAYSPACFSNWTLDKTEETRFLAILSAKSTQIKLF